MGGCLEEGLLLLPLLLLPLLLLLERHPGLTTAALSPPTGASQTDGECGEQRHVPAAHYLQGLQSGAVRNHSI